MKNTDEFLNKLASRARLEQAPAVYVVDRVITVLQRGVEEEAPSFAPLTWIAGVSVTAAVVVAIFAFMAQDTLANSLISIISEIPWGIL